MKVRSDAEQSIEHFLKAVKSICTADLIVQRAPVKSHQSQAHVDRAVRLVENQYRALLFDEQERTRVEIDPISAASAWILRRSVWLLNRNQPHKGGATSFERLFTGSPYRSPILPLFAMVECLIPSDRKTGGVLVVSRGTPRTFRSMWVGRTEEGDEHLVVNEIGRLVRARTVRRCGSDVIKLNATPSYLNPDGDDVEVRERWTLTPGCRACESAHANKHLVRCEARRYEYRLKYGRNPLVTTRGVYHEPKTVPEGTAHGESETKPVSDREREPALSSQPPSEPAQTETTHTPVKRLRLQGKQSQAQSDLGNHSQAQNRESSVTTHVDTSPWNCRICQHVYG